jgi:hypothetical protein
MWSNTISKGDGFVDWFTTISLEVTKQANHTKKTETDPSSWLGQLSGDNIGMARPVYSYSYKLSIILYLLTPTT